MSRGNFARAHFPPARAAGVPAFNPRRPDRRASPECQAGGWRDCWPSAAPCAFVPALMRTFRFSLPSPRGNERIQSRRRRSHFTPVRRGPLTAQVPNLIWLCGGVFGAAVPDSSWGCAESFDRSDQNGAETELAQAERSGRERGSNVSAHRGKGTERGIPTGRGAFYGGTCGRV